MQTESRYQRVAREQRERQALRAKKRRDAAYREQQARIRQTIFRNMRRDETEIGGDHDYSMNG